MRVVISMISKSILFCRIIMLLNPYTSLPCDETNDLANHHEVVMHMTTTHGPSSPVISNVSEHPNQLTQFKFPQWQFGKKKIVKHSFQIQWFKKWQLLHYDEAQNLAFCHVCATARKTGKMTNTGNADMAFIELLERIPVERRVLFSAISRIVTTKNCKVNDYS